jgi:glycosyltransferase involved in cell wall biosynthesis
VRSRCCALPAGPMSAAAVTRMAEIDVVVPTHRRPELLTRCLTALNSQQYPAARLIVVVRPDDLAGKRAAREGGAAGDTVQVVEVQAPGVIAAMTAGVAVSSAPVIAFTDDDASPRSDWLLRIATHFEDRAVGGVGGRDVVRGEEGPLTSSVGRFTRLGKLIGNHHLGFGTARDVEVLKGVNMAFRADALALPAEGLLRGAGAQVDFEVLTCGWARQQGWRLIYDPAILVDHEGAPRYGADQRVQPTPASIFDAAYNSIVAIAAVGCGTPVRRIVYPLIVGSRDRPGVIRGIVALAGGERDVLARVRPTLCGRVAALRARSSIIDSPRRSVVTAASLRAQT